MGRKNKKDSIKNNPKEEERLGFLGVTTKWEIRNPYEETDFDKFIDKCCKHGLIDDNTRMFLEYYSAEEKVLHK